MIARLSTYDGPVERLEELVSGLEKNRDALGGMDGFRGAYMLVDRSTGTALTLTLWASEAAQEASATEASRWRKDAAQAATHRVASVRVYEVAVQVRPTQ